MDVAKLAVLIVGLIAALQSTAAALLMTSWCSGQLTKLSSEKKLMRKVWYLVAATYDANSGKLKLYQEPCVTPTNGGLGLSLLHPADETTSFLLSVVQ